MSKKVSVNIEFNVGDSVSEAEVLKRVEKGLGSIVRGKRDPKARNVESLDIGNVSIKTGARSASPTSTGGYEMRIWEKATCCASIPDMGEVVFPEITQVLPTDKLLQGVTKIQSPQLKLDTGGVILGGGLSKGAGKKGSARKGGGKRGAKKSGGGR